MGRTNVARIALAAALAVGAGCVTACSAPPREPTCGDAFVDEDFGEECDDGNDDPGDGCAPLTCVVEESWQCTDDTPLDGEPGTCIELRCGDMRVTAGEDCDPGAASTADCDADCSLPECGDGFLNRTAGEECDDDNVMAGDGCTPACVSEPATCGDGTCQIDGEETCDNCMRDCNDHPTCNGCADADGDGYYDAACGGNDCDDTVDTTHPDASEILCNDVDDDCNAATSGTEDGDGDGWRCGLDCDDTSSAIAPELPEACGDGIDNDCDPATGDVGDADGDGVSCVDDCNDGNPMIAPTLREVCNNGVDDDCSRAVLLPGEPDSTPDVADIDGDGIACNAGDCDDYDETVRPGATEIVCDGRDNDCSPTTVEAPDLDDDGVSTCDADCDDADPLRAPGFAEICGNGYDDDCDPATLELDDEDGDTFLCDIDCADGNPTIFPDSVGRCGPRTFFTYDFDDGPQGWTAAPAPSRVSSWAHGVPTAAKTFITSCASGSAGCWMTNLSGLYMNSEYGYVTSPVLDMTAAVVDPVMTFDHIFQIQNATGTTVADSSWMEMSLDGGTTWTKLGEGGEGQNWYSDATNRVWWGTSGSAGVWRTASHVLEGAAGHTVQLRFVFQSNTVTQRDGVGLDNVVIDNQQVDIAASSVIVNRASCGPTGSVDVIVTNLGQVVVPSYDVTLVVGSGAPIVRNVTTPLVLGGSATITFTGVAYATDPVSATATVTATDDSAAGNDTTSTTRGCVGAFPIPYSPLATTGANGPSGDDNTMSVPIGFTFRFFGVNYTNAVISTNGFISFDTAPGSGCCSGQALPNAGAPNNLIAAGWTDLYVDPGEIHYETRGTAPNRIFVVSYIGVPSLSGTGNLTAQIILYETSNRVAIQTTTLTMPGRTTTQGVEGPGGTAAYFLPGRTASGTISLTNDGVEFYTN